MSLVTVRKGKVIRAEEFIFDTGEKFRAAWGTLGAGLIALRRRGASPYGAFRMSYFNGRILR